MLYSDEPTKESAVASPHEIQNRGLVALLLRAIVRIRTDRSSLAFCKGIKLKTPGRSFAHIML
eukprot:scaffold586726_cov15-Prasinocladus_malaysianus.AAC.1